MHRISLLVADPADPARGLRSYFDALAFRLRRVRVACGDWSRVVSPSVLAAGPTAIFLDPPYGTKAGRTAKLYAEDDLDVAAQACRWAAEHGTDPNLRIALCGYEGEHELPDDWTVVSWKAQGGYANRGHGPGKENAARERIWFSPHCLPVPASLPA